MNEQDKAAFEKWSEEYVEGMEFDVIEIDPEAAWQAALDFRDSGLDERFAKTYMEGMKIGELKERERSKKLIEDLEMILEGDTYDAIGRAFENYFLDALKEYRGEK